MDSSEEELLPSPDSASTAMTPQGMKKDKLCLVCGDKALGYNFNAVSCESCKAFFRRNAHKIIKGRCEGKCDVNVESRSFCKRCRLAKCFTVGMRKDMILNDEQKRMRKQKIIINKLRRHGSLPPEDTYSVSETEIKNTYKTQLQDSSIESLKVQFPNLTEDELNTLRKIKTEMKSEADTSGQTSTEVKEEYTEWSAADIFEKVIEEMDDSDRLVMEEMIKAHESSSFLANTQTQLKSLPSNATEMFNVAEGFVRRIIKVAKQLEFFRSVDKDDQIALLKGSVVEIMMLRSAVNFNIATESWSLSTVNCLSKPSGSAPSPSSSAPSPSQSAQHTSLTPPLSAMTHPLSGQATPTNSMSDRIGMMAGSGGAGAATATGGTGGSSLPLDLSKMFPGIPTNMNIDQLRQLGARLGFSRDNLPPGMSLPPGLSQPPGGAGAQQSPGATASQIPATPTQATADSTESGDKKQSSGASLSSELLKMGNSETRTMFLTYSKFIRSLMKTIHGDLMVLKFMIMMSLFSPDRPGLQDQDRIQKYQEVYATVLEKYIHLRFPEEKSMFAKCIMKLTDLRNINEVHTKMLHKMHLEDIEPLLLEIFDL